MPNRLSISRYSALTGKDEVRCFNRYDDCCWKGRCALRLTAGVVGFLSLVALQFGIAGAGIC